MSSWSHRHIAAPTASKTAPNTVSRSRSRSNSPALGSNGSGSLGRSRGAGRGGLGLNMHPNKRPVMTFLADPPLQQLQSPTVPSDEAMFPERARSNTVSIPGAPGASHTKPKGSYLLDPDFTKHWEATEMPPLPPVPHVSNGAHPSSFPSLLDAPCTDQKIRFPRATDEFLRPLDSENEGGNSSDSSRTAEKTLTKKNPSVRRRKISALDGKENAFSRTNRSATMRYQSAASNGKRNHSLPAALAPPIPSLKLENYEFTSLERLERRWADVKTESTRILSSAIYKYYFNHGEWSEFEQVFPNKVLEVWEDFQSKLSPAELAFINTILVSQNPFSAATAGDKEKNIPVLARAIPLSQVVRTMVFGEDMRSRESYSLQTPGAAPEIDPEFADWLISRFNSIKASGVTSPTEESSAAANASEKSSKPTAVIDIPKQTAPKESASERPDSNHSDKQRQKLLPPPPPSSWQKQQQKQQPADTRPISRSMSIKQYLQNHEQQPQQPEHQHQRLPAQLDKHSHAPASQAHLGLGLNTPPLTAEASSGTSSTRSSTATNNSNINTANNNIINNTNSIASMANGNAAGANTNTRPKTPSIVDVARSFIGSDRLRRKRTVEKKPAPPAPPASSGRRTTLTVPSAFQPSVHEIAKTKTPSLYGEDLNLPPSPPKKSATMATTSSRPPSRSGTVKSRRHTHNFFSSSGTASLDTIEPRRSTESVRSSFRMTREIQMKDLPPLPQKALELLQGVKGAIDPRNRIVHDATSAGKKPGNITHFSSHAELIQRTPAAVDKPRSSSLTVDALDKFRGRPSTSASIVTEAQSAKSSQSRDSGSTELRFTIVYDWRPIPEDGDCDWGFNISPLAMRKPTGRKKSTAGHMVVHSHEPTMNRRRLPSPQKKDEPLAKGTALERPKTPMPDGRSKDDQTPKDKHASSQAQKPKDKQVSQALQPKDKEKDNVKDNDKDKDTDKDKDKDMPPELPKAKMPQGQVGLGISNSTSKAAAGVAVGAAGVRGVLYELAYLSTQNKNVWTKSEHVFANMQKVGLEVNRIAEQDFYDFCVDELLKASNDAYQDLQSLGSKKMAKALYESFNSNLAVLLGGSGMQ
ncbi:hypothetical protein IW140_002958 [Coemansia sp. RSA 1813]|nr:hypothetical protein LPJ74_003063 [Coemansia sp. RSA 1843]KAJ2091388.1 hypothetical protein IW138_001847 [Coemansia sp. RSA 986]KAJ2212855.1 hypothetical protein EV179_004342 [Coemansia sp. RSA 487]KAJ2569550.1 hypothetical protein IW140_002958 [Coemansia sp. RSA 1813]